MPNGGSDCCGTCWFNSKNEGEDGYAHASSLAPNYCSIRKLEIKNAFYTYCGNHPYRRPLRDPIPIGPVFLGHGRSRWKKSPDTEQIRLHLLELLRGITEQPSPEYEAGTQLDELVVWQLGDFREQRAHQDLQRIATFSAEATDPETGRTRASLVKVAKAALAKLARAAALTCPHFPYQQFFQFAG